MPDWLLLIITVIAIIGAGQSARERHRHQKRWRNK